VLSNFTPGFLTAFSASSISLVVWRSSTSYGKPGGVNAAGMNRSSGHKAAASPTRRRAKSV
jgi:hypothetical protein